MNYPIYTETYWDEGETDWGAIFQDDNGGDAIFSDVEVEWD